jgi:putative membrane protein
VNRWKLGVAVTLLVGLALTIGSILYVGAGGLLASVEHIGWTGFALYTLYSLVSFLPVGWAWWSVAPGPIPRPWLLFPISRLVREAAADVLPFSQLAGLLVGVRTVRQGGVSEPVAVASQIVDLTTEMASQLIYTIFGVAMLTALLFHATSARNLLWTAGLALLLGVLGLGAIGFMHGRGLDLVGSLASRWIKDTQARADAVKTVIREIYSTPWRLASGFVFHSLGWVMSGVGSWIALSLMGAHIAVWKVLTLESLIAVVKSVAFMTPGALGIQESAYVLIASVFGLSAEAALSLSLLRRAKDLVIGIPAVLTWQWSELAAKKSLGQA